MEVRRNVLADAGVCAISQLSENSCQGVIRENHHSHRGCEAEKPANALGKSPAVRWNRGGACCSGRENDGTGLYFNRARYYSPAYQRFVSQDPIDFGGGINLYAYALNNPISFRDLLGLCGGVPTPDPQPNATPTGAPPSPGPPFDYTQFGDCLLSAGASPLIIAPIVCGAAGVGCLQAEAPGLNVASCKVAAAFCTATAAAVAACAAGTALPEF